MNAGDMDTLGGVLVTQGTVESYAYGIYERSGFRFSYTRVVGPIDLQTRIQLYRAILPHTIAPNYFGILDNSAGYENDFSLDAIKLLDGMLVDHGIRTYFGATITKDQGYSKIVKLAQTNMDTVGLDGALIRVRDRAAALDFIHEKIAEAAAVLP